MRWPWSDAASLELLSGTPVNCLPLKTVLPEFVEAAAARGVVTLAVIAPGGDATGDARRAMAAKVTGIAIEGDLPEGAAAGVREAAGDAPVIELTARNRMACDNTLLLAEGHGVGTTDLKCIEVRGLPIEQALYRYDT
jgi:hypothetical protein